MKVLKFGGTSVGSSTNISKVIKIVKQESASENIVVVVSAVGGITDKLFMNSFRFALIATLFPFFYLLQAGIIYYFSNFKYALIYLALCILLGFISKKTMHIGK